METWNPLKSAQPQQETFTPTPKRIPLRLESKNGFGFNDHNDGIVRRNLDGKVVDEIVSHLVKPGYYIELEIKSTGERFKSEWEYEKMIDRLEQLHTIA